MTRLDEEETVGSISDEIDNVRRRLSQIDLQSATTHFLTAIYQKTPTRRIKVTLTFPEDYPSRALVVNVAAERGVPPGLQKKLEKELGAVAQERVPHYHQAEAVLQRLMDFVDTNRFVPCWRELRQVVDRVQRLAKQNPSTKGSSIAINDSKGLIKLRLQCGKYYYSCRIVVNEAYPTTTTHADWGNACLLTMDSTNFPPKIESMLTTQAKELVRRMQDGMSATDALTMSNPIRAPKGMDHHHQRNGAPRVRLTQQALKGLKKDTDTLAHVRDLRHVNAATVEWNAKVKANSARERKEARRAINRITENEIAQDNAAEAKEKEWQQQEQARLEGYNLTDHHDPEPSLLSLVIFLENKIQRLPEETCPVCQEPALPVNPKELQALYMNADNDNMSDTQRKARRLARKRRPVRTYCGCWYHYSCLDKFMTEPPFGAACPVNGRRVYHPEWPADMGELERAWASREARKREIADAALAFL